MKKNGEYVGVDEKFIPENEKYVDYSILGSKQESKQKIKKARNNLALLWVNKAVPYIEIKSNGAYMIEIISLISNYASAVISRRCRQPQLYFNY